MIRRLRSALGDLWWVERNIRLRMRVSRWFYFRVPLFGRTASAVIDRSMHLVLTAVSLRNG